MLTPPPMPPAVLTGGKIAVAATYLFCAIAVFLPLGAPLDMIGKWTAIFILLSHVVEIAVFSPYLKAANASGADYVQVLLFGIFHTSGMKSP